MIDAKTRFVVSGIPDQELDRIRAAGRDDFGNLVTPQNIEVGDEGAPLRCCLREATAGDQVALIAYRSPAGRGAYSEVGPVFIHAQRCDGYPTPDRYPPDFRRRQQVLRAYDLDGKICDALLVAGDSADPVIAHLLSRPEVVEVESHNTLYKCFMFSVRRAT
jgi:Protein of unknown function (DUF1203)